MRASFLAFLLPLLPLLLLTSAGSFCTSDACSSELRALPTHSAFCRTYDMFRPPSNIPHAISACRDSPLKIWSACLCVAAPITSTTHTTTTPVKPLTTLTKTTTTSKHTTTSTSKSTTTATSKPTTTATTTTSTSKPTTSTTTTTTTTPSTTTSTTTTTTTSSSTTPISNPGATTPPPTTTTTTTTSTTSTAHIITAPATPIYNVAADGNFANGLVDWTVLGNAIIVSGNAYHGDGNTGSYAVQLITGTAATGRRRARRQTNGGAAGIEQILSDLDQTTQYTVSLWYYVDYTSANNAAPQNCRVDAYYGSTLFSSSPYFAANTGQSSQWIQLLSTITPSTASGNLLISLDCNNGGTAEVLIDEVFVSNQVTVNDINNISLDYSLAPTTSTSTTPLSVAATSNPPPAPTCTIHIVVPFPSGASCQKQVVTTGSPDELYIYGASGISNTDCAAACLANPNCKSMSWGPMSGAAQCVLYPQSVAAYGVAASSTSGLYVWDRACWTYLGTNGAACSATTTTTTTAIATTPAPVCTATTCSTIYPSPTSTCTDLLPNPSPPCNAVCGVAGAGNQNVYEGQFSTQAACQLGCLQSSTCKSWAYKTLCQFTDQEFLWSNLDSVWSQPGNGELWFDNECFYCAGDSPGSSCTTTTSTTSKTSTTSTTAAAGSCPTQLVVNPSFETYTSSNSAAAPWSFASFSSLQGSGTVQAAVDGSEFVLLNPGYVQYNYGPGTGQPTSASVTQSISCFDTTQTYTVEFYWYLHQFYQTSFVTTTTCSVYVQIGGTTVYIMTIPGASSTQPTTWNYNHGTANFVPTSSSATLLVGADCAGDEGFVNVDLITIYLAGSSSGVPPNHQYPSP